jgi:hypothetical protein
MAATDPTGMPQLMTPGPCNPPNSTARALKGEAPYKSVGPKARGSKPGHEQIGESPVWAGTPGWKNLVR